jgi:hypothetical protein
MRRMITCNIHHFLPRNCVDKLMCIRWSYTEAAQTIHVQGAGGLLLTEGQ